MQLKTGKTSVDNPCYHADYSYSRESLEESDLWSFAYQIATGMVSDCKIVIYYSVMLHTIITILLNLHCTFMTEFVCPFNYTRNF